MALWVVRAGSHGEQEETALSKNVVCHGWNELPDYGQMTKEEINGIFRRIDPQAAEKKIISALSQVWPFANEIAVGDIVALPIKSTGSPGFQFGEVVGPYRYQKLSEDVYHTRAVRWLTQLQRSLIPADILRSMSLPRTVYRVKKNDALARITKLIETPIEQLIDVKPQETMEDELEESINFEDAARDEITKFIQTKFKTHDFTDLIAAILRTYGFKTDVSPAGPDGGIDIFCGSGPLGLDQPLLAVQVKSGLGTAGMDVFNQLIGVVSKFSSQQGLFVSWGGFTKDVRKDAKNQLHRIKLWGSDEVMKALLENYDKLDEDLRVDLPLKRIWTLIETEPA